MDSMNINVDDNADDDSRESEDNEMYLEEVKVRWQYPWSLLTSASCPAVVASPPC